MNNAKSCQTKLKQFGIQFQGCMLSKNNELNAFVCLDINAEFEQRPVGSTFKDML